jgi:photosystem II stability/assembly factor-like uncharacterized protein
LQTGLLRRKIDDPAWTPVNNGLPAVPMVRIAVDASSQGLVYAAAGAAVWVSGDAGMTWSFSPGVNIGPTRISALATDASTSGTAYCGVEGCVRARADPPSSICYGGLLKTTDAGQHWQWLPAPSTLGSVQAFGLDPIRPQILYVAGHVDKYVGFRSADGGVTWELLANGFPNGPVSRFLVDSLAPDSIYVAAGNAVFKSSDGGASWSATGLSNAAVSALVQDPRRRILYAGSVLGLFHSEDAGETWTLRVFPGGVLALAIDRRSGTVYAATATTGVQASSDGGQTWFPLGSGLPDVSVSDIALSSDGSSLYAATDKGVYLFQFRPLRNVGLR